MKSCLRDRLPHLRPTPWLLAIGITKYSVRRLMPDRTEQGDDGRLDDIVKGWDFYRGPGPGRR